MPPILPKVSRRNPGVLTIAHRGVWSEAPENSLAAIRAAIALGVEIVEIDVQTTADGRLAIIHDATLDRTSTGSGIVSELSFATIREARLRHGAGGPDAAVTDERVPSLEEALEEARGRVLINLDTKYDRDLGAVTAAVRRLGAADGVIIKTLIDPEPGAFPVMDAEWFADIPHMPRLAVRPGRFSEDLRAIRPLGAPMIEVTYASLADLAEGREELERQDIRLWVNTIDVSYCLDFCDSRALSQPDGVWGALVDAGVGAVQTDVSVAFKSWLDGRRLIPRA